MEQVCHSEGVRDFVIGDIAFRIIDYVRKTSRAVDEYNPRVTVMDINQNMLNVGERRAYKMGYSKSMIMPWILV